VGCKPRCERPLPIRADRCRRRRHVSCGCRRCLRLRGWTDRRCWSRRQRDVAAAVGGDVAGRPVVGECLAARAAESTPAFPIWPEATVLFLAAVLPPAEATALGSTSEQLQPAAVLFLAVVLPSAEVAALEPASARFQPVAERVLPRLELIPASSPWDAPRAARTLFRMPDPLVATAVAHAAARSAAAQRLGHAPVPSRPARQVVVVKAG
jgi:hypothetical protein